MFGSNRRRAGGAISVLGRAADGSRRMCVLFVARAFQPEICSFAFGSPGDRGTGVCALRADGLKRSSEAAKGNAEVGFRYSLFGQAIGGRQSAGVAAVRELRWRPGQ